MKLNRFKELSKLYSELPLAKEVVESKEYNDYINALNDNIDCANWHLEKRITEAGINYKKYCCLDMAFHLIEDIKNKKHINYDSIITESSKKEFGIPIHDGGSSFIKIIFCPWCGKKL